MLPVTASSRRRPSHQRGLAPDAADRVIDSVDVARQSMYEGVVRLIEEHGPQVIPTAANYR